VNCSELSEPSTSSGDRPQLPTWQENSLHLRTLCKLTTGTSSQNLVSNLCFSLFVAMKVIWVIPRQATIHQTLSDCVDIFLW